MERPYPGEIAFLKGKVWGNSVKSIAPVINQIIRDAISAATGTWSAPEVKLLFRYEGIITHGKKN